MSISNFIVISCKSFTNAMQTNSEMNEHWKTFSLVNRVNVSKKNSSMYADYIFKYNILGHSLGVGQHGWSSYVRGEWISWIWSQFSWIPIESGGSQWISYLVYEFVLPLNNSYFQKISLKRKNHKFGELRFRYLECVNRPNRHSGNLGSFNCPKMTLTAVILLVSIF